MSLFDFIQLGLIVWEKIAERTKYTGDEKMASEALAVLAAIRKFAGSKVYKNQLKKVSMEWPTTP